MRLEELFDSEASPLLVLGLLLDLTELEGASNCPTDGFAFKSICYGLLKVAFAALLFIRDPSPYRLLLTAAV